jgi:nucleoside-diphosphate-sugar epimerase
VRAVVDDFEVLVLRLGAVFGVGGLNIVSFVKEVSSAPLWKLALRRILYGKRRMHLVSVEKIVETLVFVVGVPRITQGEVILVTDDDSLENNFAYLQDVLMKSFGRPSLSLVPHLPSVILGILLRARGISNSNPMRRFQELRLAELGQKDGANFKRQLQRYVDYLRQQA